MKATYQIRASAESRGNLPFPWRLPVPCRGPLEGQLDKLKERLLRPFLNAATDAALARELMWAANEATALAWYTAYPTLLLPVLLEERIRAALAKWEKQTQIRRR